MHIPEMHTKKDTATKWLRGEEVGEVPWQLWDLPNEDLIPHDPPRDILEEL